MSAMRGSGEQAYRMAWLAYRAVARRRISWADRKSWAAELGVCERTIRRTLQALEQGGWPIPEWRQERSL